MIYWLFSQRFPFFRDNEVVKTSRLEDVADAVTNAPITFDFGPWLSMSDEGLDFVQRCLERDERKRLTVQEALRHPWLLTASAARPAYVHKLQGHHQSSMAA